MTVMMRGGHRSRRLPLSRDAQVVPTLADILCMYACTSNGCLPLRRLVFSKVS